MRHPKFNPARRQFALQLAETASLLALAASGLRTREARAAAAALNEGEPRFLINIHTRGGLDSFWWHNHCRSQDVRSYVAANPGKSIDGLYSERFSDGDVIAHPTAPGHTLGPGMSLFTPAEIAQMAIWKGMQPGGDHDIGNTVINKGMFSTYAASFSALSSMALAERSLPLPLHYVQASKTALELFSGAGLLGGYATAVNLPDAASLSVLLGQIAGDLPEDRRSALAATMRKLGEAAASSGFRLKSSKSMYETFMSSFSAVNGFYGKYQETPSGYVPANDSARGPNVYTYNAFAQEFWDTVEHYRQTARSVYWDDFRARSTTMRDLLGQGEYGAGGAPSINNRAERLAYFMPGRVDPAAFNFALAEFLIKKGLTRVIEIGPRSLDFDAHNSNGAEFGGNIIKYTMLRELMRRLAQIPCPGMAGKSVMDQATIVMSTEFDRLAWLYSDPPGSAPGTNHGSTSSAIFIGKGVKPGVYGDFKTAPGAYGKYSAFGNVNFLTPLPVDPATGQPSLSGKIISTKAILPTICRILGAKIPEQQQTEETAFLPICA